MLVWGWSLWNFTKSFVLHHHLPGSPPLHSPLVCRNKVYTLHCTTHPAVLCHMSMVSSRLRFSPSWRTMASRVVGTNTPSSATMNLPRNSKRPITLSTQYALTVLLAATANEASREWVQDFSATKIHRKSSMWCSLLISKTKWCLLWVLQAFLRCHTCSCFYLGAFLFHHLQYYLTWHLS